jgi:hypothetical protein
MNEPPEPPKPSTQRNAIIQIALIILAVVAISIWNSEPKPARVIEAPKATVAPPKASPKAAAIPPPAASSIAKPSPAEERALVDRATTRPVDIGPSASSGSPERQEFIKSCLASLTEGEEPAVMSVAPAEREAMCAMMYTAR